MKKCVICLMSRVLSCMDEVDWEGVGVDLVYVLKDVEVIGEVSMVGYVCRICGDLVWYQEDGDIVVVYFEVVLELVRFLGDWVNEVCILCRLGFVVKM